MPNGNVIKKSALSPTVLIVGGAGFIGSHLTEALLLKDARVIVADNFSTGKDIYVNSLLNNPKFALFNVNINQNMPPEIQSVDYVFHLAGLETYLFDKNDVSIDTLLTNAIGTKNVLDFCLRAGAKFLLASSIDVYRGIISPLSLDQYFGHTLEDEKKYSLSEAKRYAEALVWEYYKKHHIDVRIARLPEVYGPRMSLDSSGNLGRLLKNLMENRDLVVYGDGVEKENYIFISDAVSGLIKALMGENTAGKIFSFVPKESHTVLETTYLVKGLANAEPRIVFKQQTEKIILQEPKNIDKSNLKEIGWEEKIIYKEGIIKTLNWFGYQSNEHAFKPTKIIEESQKVSTIVQATPQGVSVVVPAVVHAPRTKSPFRIKLPKFAIFGFFNKSAKKQETAGVSKPPLKSSKMHMVFAVYAFLIFTALIVFVGVPVLQTYVHVRNGVNNIEKVESALLSFSAVSAQASADEAFKEFHKAKSSLLRIGWFFTITNQKDYFNNAQSVLTSATYVSKSLYNVGKGADVLANFWQTVKPNSEATLDQPAFASAAVNFEAAKTDLKLAQAEVQGVDFVGLYFEDISHMLSDYKVAITNLQTRVTALSAFIVNGTELLGLEQPKQYLILFQNSNEIRPTGGFIGSYAVLELKGGKITNLTIDDIYNPDGQIDLREIEVAAPTPIQSYLQEDVLHIRNANWSPDFPTSARAIEDLFFKIDGRQFDGILAVDLYFVESILKITGPVYLTAYNEEITSDNIYEKTQFHSEFNYEEGSEQKRSFLTVLGGKLLEAIFSLENEELYALFDKLSQALSQKHLLVYIPNNPINAFFDESGWNGKLNSTAGDYLFVVNSNLGGTKANYYVKNDMNYSVSSVTRDGLLRGALKLKYTHSGEDNAWPGGPYTNYVRVLTQDGSKLTGAKVTFDNGETEDVFGEVAILKEGSYNSFELGFVLEPKQAIEVVFEYDLPQKLSLTKENKNYMLYWQKQPGTQNDNISFAFSGPFGMSIAMTQPQMDFGSNTAEFIGVLNTDTQVSIKME